MDNYKDTLNLPITDFPMRGNLAEKEPERLKKWEADKLYQLMIDAKDPQKIFVLHDGPPYANGNIHLGHALNKVIKDIIVKSKALSGYYTPFIPGWDCHGLPIELKVEKNFGLAIDKKNPYQFQQACRQYASEQVALQKKDFMRLGILGDWNHPYLTMDFDLEGETVLILSKLLKAGYVVRGNKPVNWCTSCYSSLAEAEVEYHDITSSSVYVKFPAVDEKIISKKFNSIESKTKISFLIWTTTIWTLPANRAIALNRDIEYSMIEYGQPAERLILASALVDKVMEKQGVQDFKLLGTCKGADLELQKVKHPIYSYEVPIILGEHVSNDSGTGIVHTAPAHGQDDYNIGQLYKLEITNLLSGDGRFLPGTEHVENQSIAEANNTLLELLKMNDCLFFLEKHLHSYPHCWRHKTPIIFRATPQWFIDLSKKNLREHLIQEILKVRWHPERGENLLKIMVENRPDWCISRQRVWGVPMCLFIHKHTQELHPDMPNLMEKIAEKIKASGVESWWTLDKNELLGKDADDYDKIFDTLDVWFESGCTNLSVVNRRKEYHQHLADLYMEGIDQYRGWLMSSLVLSTAVQQKAPYKQVLTHGFTVDSNGHKMSKSMGNGIEPSDIVDEYGADILRLWVASTEYTREMTLSKQILQSTSDLYRRIRNTGRYLLASLHDFNPDTDLLPENKLLPLDRWAIDAAYHTQLKIIESYENYQFHKILKSISHFCTIEMGAFYFEIIKDRLYTMQNNSLGRRSCQTAIYQILQAFVRWIAPILSFTADEIWGYIPGKKSQYVFTEEWYSNLFPIKQDDLTDKKFWDFILTLQADVNKAIEIGRNNSLFADSREVEVNILINSAQAAKYLEFCKNELHYIFLTSKINVIETEEFPEDAILNQDAQYAISVRKTQTMKCARCWQHTDSVGENPEHPKICVRCSENLYGSGESRQYV